MWTKSITRKTSKISKKPTAEKRSGSPLIMNWTQNTGTQSSHVETPKLETPWRALRSRRQTRRSKIVSRATGRYAATGFDQLLVLVCGRGGGIIYLSPKAIPRFDRLASLDRPRFLRFPKKVMKKVITHNLKTFSVYSAIQSMFCHPFSLFTFDFNHVSSFPRSACYYAEVLGLLVQDFVSIFFGFFSSPIDRPTDPKSGNAFDSKQDV